MKVGALPLSYRYQSQNRLSGIVLQAGIEATYRFFHPPLCPGLPPVERPRAASREEVGWTMRLSELGLASSGVGLRGAARLGR